jgi:hypothetical protein
MLMIITPYGHALEKDKKDVKDAKSDPLAKLAVEDTPDDAYELAVLKDRRRFLDAHFYSAWASVGLMGLTLITAPDNEKSNTHKWLGIMSGLSYLSSAGFAYFAPKPTDVKQTENILIHKKLIWVHAPAMFLTIMSGISAHDQHKEHKKLDSFADAHKLFAAITAVSFGLATLSSMDWTLNFLPVSKKEVACVFTKTF